MPFQVVQHSSQPQPILNPWFRRRYHESATELLVGFYKKGSAKPSITWPESVDEALCVGWIDGVRRSIDDTSYTIRFTPRKRGSTWSATNIRRVGELTQAGRMHPAGLAAFEARTANKSGIYSYEQTEPATLSLEMEATFRANTKAWNYFESKAPSYRKTAIHWVTRAKQEATREKRLAQLIDDCANERVMPQWSWRAASQEWRRWFV